MMTEHKPVNPQENNATTTGALLREVVEEDLDVFFEQQRDPVANHMAAFTAKDPTDRHAFGEHWARILSDDEITIRTIVSDGHVAGHIAGFERWGEPEVTYWIGREFWGKGLATQALSAFLADVTDRPLYARAAEDNLASIGVLEKCGFAICGSNKAFANARGEEITEVILKLGP